MKVLVHGDSLGAGADRMRLAAAGLALRGHEVAWLGTNAPEALVGDGNVTRLLRSPLWIRDRMDLVLGGPRRPFRTAASGWCAGVHAMVLALDREALRGWSAADHWAWGSLDSYGVIEAGVPDGDAEIPGGAAESRSAWSEDPPPEGPDAAHPDTEVLERACERWIARRRGHAPRAAVFLDRDGTLIVEKEYLAHAEDLELLPEVPEALSRLHAAGFALVVISNQSGVGRGLFPLSVAYQTMARLRRELRRHGVELDAIHFCPHRPEDGCACRKPGTALIREAARQLNLVLKRSTMVGDKLLDVETGHRCGAAGVLVRSGYGRDEERRAGATGASPPDWVAEDLMGAAAWIVERGGVAD